MPREQLDMPFMAAASEPSSQSSRMSLRLLVPSEGREGRRPSLREGRRPSLTYDASQPLVNGNSTEVTERRWSKVSAASSPAATAADEGIDLEACGQQNAPATASGMARSNSCYSVQSAGGSVAPRILDREQTFKQSSGRLKIRRHNASYAIRWLRWSDFFHSLVNFSTPKLMLLCCLIIIFSWWIFAVLFRLVGQQCGLKNDTFLKSFYLSIETIETIGYGVKDSYFNNCTSGIFVLGAAALWESLLNAVLIGLVYTRISRAQSRASSICFSEKAVIAQIDGKSCFMFQVCDFRKHQLCEAHVRLYCVRHTDTGDGTVFQTRAMRLQHPDDELGGMLLLALPQLCVHGIDVWSPLYPQAHSSTNRLLDINRRLCDTQVDDSMSDGSSTPRRSGEVQPAFTLMDIAQHLRDGSFEVLCIVEGIDPSTSSTLQARYSYTCDDIVFNASFQHCVHRGADGTCEINFDAFHEVVEQPPGSPVFVQSMP